MARLGRQRKAVATSAKEARKTLVCAVCGKGDGKYKCPKCRAPYCCVQCSKDHKTVHCPFVTDTSNTKGEGTSSKNHSENSTNVKSDKGNPAEKSKYLPGKVVIPSKQAFRRKRRRDNDEDSDDQDDEPGWNITPEMKKRIQQSSWLKKELQDGGLRHLIATIDAASDSEDDEDDIDEQNGNAPKFKKQKNYQKNANTATPKISPRVLELARTKHSHPKFANFVDKLLLTMGVLMPADDGNKDRDLGTLLNEILNGEGDESYRGRLVLAPVPRQGRILESEDVSDSDSDSSDESEDEESSEDSSSSSEEDEVCETKGEK